MSENNQYGNSYENYNQNAQNSYTDYNQNAQNFPNNNQPKKSNKTCLILGIVMGVLTIIVGAIIAILVIVGLSVIKPKEDIDSREFKEYMSNAGYVITDATNQFPGVGTLGKVYVAVDTLDGYQIEFYEFYDLEAAEMFYANNKKIFEESEDDSVLKSHVDGTNHHKYVLKTKYKYKVLSLVDNTVIYINAIDDAKEEIDEILEELGY